MIYDDRMFKTGVLTLALCLAGCGDKDDNTDSGAATDNTSNPTGPGDDGDPSVTMPMDSADDETADGGPGDTTPGTDDDPSDPTFGDDGPDPLPDGANCSSDEDCESMQCFDAGILGGFCGECNEDADCRGGGCSIPVPPPLSDPPIPSACNDGSLGGGCETDDACQRGLVCAEIISVPMVITANTCSECESDADCPGEDLCAPTYIVASVSGHKSCVTPLSVVNGEGCDLLGSGDQQCESTHCTSVDLFGFAELGVCSECATDDDCTGGQTCMPAELDLAMGSIAPATCVD